MPDATLHTKYRPIKLSDVVGQDSVVRSLDRLISGGLSRTLLFTGPSGVGKTTIARIVAAEVGCSPEEIRAGEHDAARNTGVDAMRSIYEMLDYRPIGGEKRALIIDECHRLSGAAWDSMLKAIEEPPPWAHWFLCTTEPTKVPKTVVTRCVTYQLKLVRQSDLEKLLNRVVKAEGIKLASDRIVALCARESDGSPRQALVNLAACSGAGSASEARELLRSADKSPEAVELARALLRGARWAEVQGLLRGLADTSPESVRHVVRAYVTKAVLGASSDRAAGRGMSILDAFSDPCNPQDGMSPIVLACGRVVLGEIG